MAIIGDSRYGGSGFYGEAGLGQGRAYHCRPGICAVCRLIKIFGYEKVNKLLPPIVTGPIIIVIGLRLSGTAINSAFYYNGEFSLKSVLVTVVILTVVICVSIFAKGIFNLMPILFAIIAGYLVCLPLGFCDLPQ